jgi:hypothetical protein
MRRPWSLAWPSLSFIALIACAPEPPPPAAAPTAEPNLADAFPPEEDAGAPDDAGADNVPPDDAIRRADGLYRDRLAVPARDERFSAERQIVVLERAIGLYRQFLERAGDEPRYAEAAKRSRDRIADAEETITFLRGEIHRGRE